MLIEAAGAEPLSWELVAWAVALLVLSAVILVLEFFVVSFGLLTAVSIACLGGAIYFAFLAGPTAGWTLTIVTPVLAVQIVRWGSSGSGHRV